jgi:hypothetical protein
MSGPKTCEFPQRWQLDQRPAGIPEEIKPNKPGRKRKYESDSERQREYRKRKKEAKLMLLTGLEDLNKSWLGKPEQPG